MSLSKNNYDTWKMQRHGAVNFREKYRGQLHTYDRPHKTLELCSCATQHSFFAIAAPAVSLAKS